MKTNEKPKGEKKSRIVIVVRSGLISDVYTEKDAEITIIDYDMIDWDNPANGIWKDEPVVGKTQMDEELHRAGEKVVERLEVINKNRKREKLEAESEDEQ